MIVPNYIPEPLEVPGNVAEQPYPVRVRFVRVVTLWFGVSVLAAAAMLQIGLPRIGPLSSILALVGTLVTLELWRILMRSRPVEGVVSSMAIPAVLAVVALALQELRHAGWPVWQGLAAPACVAVYTVMAGRDYSFLGNFSLSLIFSSLGIAAVANSLGMELRESAFALGTNALFLGYVLYDLASLLSRRRPREPLAAVADLYRDVLNFFGYFVRVVRHWHKHRILSLPSPIDLRRRSRT